MCGYGWGRDGTVGLDDAPDAYRAMADRQAVKVLISP
jgi:threonine dehydrogenase-like Zn-dependent dehydrogenase